LITVAATTTTLTFLVLLGRDHVRLPFGVVVTGDSGAVADVVRAHPAVFWGKRLSHSRHLCPFRMA